MRQRPQSFQGDRGRLISVHQAQEGGDDAPAEAELAHEWLIDSWPQLVRWRHENRAEIGAIRQLEQAADLWNRRGRRAEELWEGSALDDARRAIEHSTEPVGEVVSSFVQLADARRRRRRNRKRRLTIGAVAALLLVALGAGFAALRISAANDEAVEQRDRARRSQQAAESGRAAAQQQDALAALSRGALVEARAKLLSSLLLRDSALARLLWLKLSEAPLIWKQKVAGNVYAVAITPDDRTIAAGCGDATVQVIDRTTQSITRVLRGHDDKVLSVAFDQSGKTLAAGGWGGRILVWDLRRS